MIKLTFWGINQSFYSLDLLLFYISTFRIVSDGSLILDDDEKKEESIDNDEKKEESIDNDEKKDDNNSEKDTESCDDKEGAIRCGNWKSEGYCETNKELKEIFCKRTCGACEGLTPAEG